MDVGARPLARAHRVVHHVAQGLALACVSLLLTDGFREYTPALLRGGGPWGPPPR